MEQVFDWLREHLEETANDVSPNTDKLVVLARVERLINEAEAKWEAEVCEWKFFKPSNSLYENHGDFRTGDELEKWNFCPYCGKPIKISEVE